MKRFIVSFITLFVFAASLPSVFADELSADQIFEKMKKAADPKGVREKLKTMIIKGKMKFPAQQMAGDFEFIDKYPDKSKSITQIPGLMRSVQGFNGTVAWESANAMGVREITGRELEFVKFSALLKNPKSDFKEIFSKVKLENGVTVNGSDCYKLVCFPSEKFGLKPVVMYVDKKTFYVLKVEMVAVTMLGEIPTVAVMSDFKEINGLIEPMVTVLTQLTTKMEMEVTSIKLNEKVDDSIFNMPKK